MRVLAVDDDPDVLMLLSVTLEEAGWRVLAASDAAKAYALLTVAEVDAVILDVVMPEVSGYELLSLLRSEPYTRLLPVLLLSSLGEASEERVRGLRLGANDFLRKPFEPEEVLVRLERMVDQRTAPPGGVAGEIHGRRLGDLLERLFQDKASGLMRVEGRRRHGQILLDCGRIASARFGLLEEAEAVQAMLTIEDGFYALAPFDDGIPREGSIESLDIAAISLEEARLRDRLLANESPVPAASESLYVQGELDHQQPGRGLRRLPLALIYERVRVLPGITLGELEAQEVASPLKVKLAVSILIGEEVLTTGQTA